eukprot:TRINITY_DN56526_c0_g1_i1.p1 TRINITY_DN56526_c0_g1~~TRINITY_DN56526_c0_g1_i1.p1  ORF type:complete len:710 (+),score=142.20 TRINITY_DN56526_c0_g1_i1:76-2205(+)
MQTGCPGTPPTAASGTPQSAGAQPRFPLWADYVGDSGEDPEIAAGGRRSLSALISSSPQTALAANGAAPLRRTNSDTQARQPQRRDTVASERWGFVRQQVLPSRSVVVKRGAARVAIVDFTAVADGLRLPRRSISRALAQSQARQAQPRPAATPDASASLLRQSRDSAHSVGESFAAEGGDECAGHISRVAPGVLRISRGGEHPAPREEPSLNSPVSVPADIADVELGDEDAYRLTQGELGLIVRQRTEESAGELEVHIPSADGSGWGPAASLTRSRRSRSDPGEGDHLIEEQQRQVAFAADPVQSVVVYDATDDNIVLRVVTRVPPLCFLALLCGAVAASIFTPTIVDAADSAGLSAVAAVTRGALTEVLGAVLLCALWLWGLVVTRGQPDLSITRPHVAAAMVAAGVCHSLAAAARAAAAAEARNACEGAACPPVALQSFAGLVIAAYYSGSGEPVHRTELAGTFLSAAAPCLMLLAQVDGARAWRADIWAVSVSLAVAAELLLYRSVTYRVSIPLALLFGSFAGLVTLFAIAAAAGEQPAELLRILPAQVLIGGALNAVAAISWLFVMRFLDALTIAAVSAAGYALGAAVVGSDSSLGLGNWHSPDAVSWVAAGLGVVAVLLCCYGSVRHRSTREIMIAVTQKAKPKSRSPVPSRSPRESPTPRSKERSKSPRMHRSPRAPRHGIVTAVLRGQHHGPAGRFLDRHP